MPPTDTNAPAFAFMGVPMRLVQANHLGNLTAGALSIITESAPTFSEAEQARNAARRGDLSALADLLQRTGRNLKTAEQRSRIQAAEVQKQLDAAATDRAKLHGVVTSFLYDLGYDGEDLSDANVEKIAEVLSEAFDICKAGEYLTRLEAATTTLEAAAKNAGKWTPVVSVGGPDYSAAAKTASLDAANRRILAGSGLNVTSDIAPDHAAHLVGQHVAALRSNAQVYAARIRDLEQQLHASGLQAGPSPRESELEKQLAEARAEINALRNGVVDASVATGYNVMAMHEGFIPLTSQQLVEQLIAFVNGLVQNGQAAAAQVQQFAEQARAWHESGADRAVRDRDALAQAVIDAIEGISGYKLNRESISMAPIDIAALIDLLQHHTAQVVRQRNEAKQPFAVLRVPTDAPKRVGKRRAALDNMAALLALVTTFYHAKVRDPGTPANLDADFQIALFLPGTNGKKRTTTVRFDLPRRYLPWFDHLEHEGHEPVEAGSRDRDRLLDEVTRRITEHPAGGTETAGLALLRKVVRTIVNDTPECERVSADSTNKQLAKALVGAHRFLSAQYVEADAFAEARKNVANLEAALHQARRERDSAFTDRAHVLALLAAHYSTTARMDHSDPKQPDWPVLTFDLEFEVTGTGFMQTMRPKSGTQVSFHIAPADLPLFGNVRWDEQRSLGQQPIWRPDGHTRMERNRRLLVEVQRVARLRPALLRLSEVETKLAAETAERGKLKAQLVEMSLALDTVLGVLSAHYPSKIELPNGKYSEGTLWVTLPGDREVWFPMTGGSSLDRFSHVTMLEHCGSLLNRYPVSERNSRLWDEAKRLVEHRDKAEALAGTTLADAAAPQC